MGTESEFSHDQAFVQPPEHRPKPSDAAEAQGVPLIDLSGADLDDLVKRIGKASEEWGFFQVINHGVVTEKRRRVEAAAAEFFAMAAEEKRKVRRDEVRVLGYYDGENTKNVRDWKEVFDFTVEEPTLIPASPAERGGGGIREWTNQWPEKPAGLREACEEYGEEVQRLSTKLMELIALSLGLPPNRFSGFFRDQTSFLRLNHYPKCHVPHLALGVGRHKDAGALTVLAQDGVGGLEVKQKGRGEWVRVKPVPDSFIVNVGDIIQVWSNDRYESVEHRVVVNSERERFSIPFFLNPSHYTVVGPLPELVTKSGPAKYLPYNWGEFFVARKASNFRKMTVENIQIGHFRLSE